MGKEEKVSLSEPRNTFILFTDLGYRVNIEWGKTKKKNYEKK